MRRSFALAFRDLLVASTVALAVFLPGPGLSAPGAVQPSLVAPVPGWVVERAIPTPGEMAMRDRTGSAYALLLDTQRDLESKSGYFHLAARILSQEGVQQLSDISLDYDPTYHTIALHRLRLHRGGRIIDKSDTPYQTLQRETNLERHMYDGSLTVSIRLSDVRVGDILEYSFSLRGQNPAYGGHDFGELDLEMQMPVEQLTARLRVPDGREVTLQHRNTDLRPEVRKEAGYTTYEWTRRQVGEFVYDDNVPAWYRPTARVAFTDFGNWREMVDWALPLFAVSAPERARLRAVAGEILSGEKGDAAVLKAIRFVQDEVRYLLLSQGMSAYRPHPPAQVWEQRYGDCKDKSLLLATLLNELGVEAYPMLVRFEAPRSADDFMVAPGDFDHCVVAFRQGGKARFVDPTATHQGGDLDHLYFPDYRFGLVISPDSHQLTPLPVPDPGRTDVTEYFRLDAGGGGTLTVGSEYRGVIADGMRATLATLDLTGLQNQFLSFYAALYPEIAVAEDLVYRDERRDADNVLVMSETYRIENIWLRSDEDTSLRYVQLFPLQLDKTTMWNSNPDRTMPFRVGRIEYRHEIVVEPPEPMQITPGSVSISGKGFEYAKSIFERNGQFRVVHQYRRTVEDIEAADVADFVSKHDRVRTHLDDQIVRGGRGDAPQGISWIMSGLFLVCMTGAVWAARRIYVRYDPAPAFERLTRGPKDGIDGLLILPAIGLVLFAVQGLPGLPEMVGCFDAAVFHAFGPTFATVIAMEVLFYGAGVVMWVLVTVSFFKRRSSVPVLYMAFMAATVAYQAVSGMLTEKVAPPELAGSDTEFVPASMIVPLLQATVWILYFKRSRRVRWTFVERGPAHVPPPGVETLRDPLSPAVSAPGLAPAVGPDENTPEGLEQIAAAKLAGGMPPREVARWLVEHGVSPAMAGVLVDVLSSHRDRKEH